MWKRLLRVSYRRLFAIRLLLNRPRLIVFLSYSDFFHLEPNSSAVKPPLAPLPQPEKFLRNKSSKLASSSSLSPSSRSSVSGRSAAVDRGRPAHGFDTRPSSSSSSLRQRQGMVAVPSLPVTLEPPTNLWDSAKHVEDFIAVHLPPLTSSGAGADGGSSTAAAATAAAAGSSSTTAVQLRLQASGSQFARSNAGSGAEGISHDDDRASFSLTIGSSCAWGFFEFAKRVRCRRRRRSQRSQKDTQDKASLRAGSSSSSSAEKMDVDANVNDANQADEETRFSNGGSSKRAKIESGDAVEEEDGQDDRDNGEKTMIAVRFSLFAETERVSVRVFKPFKVSVS